MKRGDELDLTIESVALEGKGVARADGMVVFVRGGVSGDEVRSRVWKTKKRFVEAETIAVLSPSPLRTTPRCRFFGVCGGCTWQHVHYAAQLEFKRQHVIDTLERIGGFKGVAVNEVLGSEDSYYYRNKMEFSFGDRWLQQSEHESRPDRPPEDRFALGLHIPDRFDKVLDIDECWLQSEASAGIVNLVRTFCAERRLSVYSTFTHTGYLRNLVIREGKRSGDRMVNLVTSEERPEIVDALCARLLAAYPTLTTFVNNITRRKSQVAVGETEKVWHGPGYITEKIGSRTYRISSNSFFQTNTAQAERLYDVARTMAKLSADATVFDLYSGAGTIALHVAGGVAGVVGVESVESAVEDARRNAAFNGVANCTFLLGDLKDRLTKEKEWLAHHPHPDVIIVDPPRAGMHERVVQEILALRPGRIVYVSCNPATQARDLKLLCGPGAYGLEEVQPVDMFPHTSHVEVVASLGLRSPR